MASVFVGDLRSHKPQNTAPPLKKKSLKNVFDKTKEKGRVGYVHSDVTSSSEVMRSGPVSRTRAGRPQDAGRNKGPKDRAGLRVAH